MRFISPLCASVMDAFGGTLSSLILLDCSLGGLFRKGGLKLLAGQKTPLGYILELNLTGYSLGDWGWIGGLVTEHM